MNASIVKLTLLRGINDVKRACLAEALNKAASPKIPGGEGGHVGGDRGMVDIPGIIVGPVEGPECDDA